MKRKIINSFLILSATSALSKVFSLINRMLLARLLTLDQMALFVLLIPTLSLCITLGQLGIPSAVFRLVANPKYSTKKVVISASFISFLSTCVISLLLCLSASYLATNLLHAPNATASFYCLALFIPIVGISGIIKNYFLAKQNVYIIAKAQIIEEVSRLLFVYLSLHQFHYLKDQYLVAFAFVAMIVGECMSIAYMIVRLDDKPKYFISQLSNIKECLIAKDLLNIAIPVTGTRLYHSLVSFLEPIVLLSVLSASMTVKSIQTEYAILSGFVISMLVTPTFFNTVIYRIYLPIVTKEIYDKRFKSFHRHFLIALSACFLISIPFTVVFYFFPDYCLSLLYNTTNGAQYLKYMAIPFTIFYLQTPLSAVLHALNKNKELFIISFIECSLELVLLYVLSPIYGVVSVAISLLIGVSITLTLTGLVVYKNIYCS